MQIEPGLLHIFAFHHENGVPVEPMFRLMEPEQVERFAVKLMRDNQNETVLVYDWQHDGIRMRLARLRDKRRVYWSNPMTYWLLHGDLQ